MRIEHKKVWANFRLLSNGGTNRWGTSITITRVIGIKMIAGINRIKSTSPTQIDKEIEKEKDRDKRKGKERDKSIRQKS